MRHFKFYLFLWYYFYVSWSSAPVRLALDGRPAPETVPLSGIIAPGLPSYNEALNRSGQHDAPPPPYSGYVRMTKYVANNPISSLSMNTMCVCVCVRHKETESACLHVLLFSFILMAPTLPSFFLLLHRGVPSEPPEAANE